MTIIEVEYGRSVLTCYCNVTTNVFTSVWTVPFNNTRSVQWIGEHEVDQDNGEEEHQQSTDRVGDVSTA